ncbi:MAG: hypothetical protein WBN86_10455 [Porticoccaceae bacterium]
MTQLTLAEAEYATKKRKTRREVFLEKMDALIPWKQLEKKLSKHCHKGGTGRPPYPLSTMLRVHCLQLFCNLSDPPWKRRCMKLNRCTGLPGRNMGQV